MNLVPVKTEIMFRQRSKGFSYRELNKNPRIYVSIANESIFENLVLRRSRPTKVFRQAATTALKEKGITPKKMRWSQYAGCSCPCSPGFILDDFDFEKGTISSFQFDVFVSVDEATK
jgi:hypothetical protein